MRQTLTPPNTLAQWEKQLKPRFATIQLIGELNLSLEEVNQIGILLCRLITSYGIEEATRQLDLSYSCTLATYLVFEGWYFYQKDYWSAICSTTGLPHNGTYKTIWGQIFEEVLKEFDLQCHFVGYRYVSAILGHGGIPLDFLPYFFEKMLQPSIEDRYQLDLTASTLVQRWVKEPTRRAIMHFLQHGGKVAEYFIECCRDMALETTATGAVPLAKEIDLPRAVVREYQRWIAERQQQEQAPRPRSMQIRLRRPIIRMDPWGKGIILSLPAQIIPFGQVNGQVHWEVINAGESTLLWANKHTIESGYQTKPLTELLSKPPQSLRVSFHLGDTCLREWIMDDLTVRIHYPFILFDRETYELIPRRDLIRAKPIWILLLPDVRLFDQNLISESLPRLPGQWAEWQAHEIDLSNVEYLKLVTLQQTLSFEVIDSVEPFLQGDVLELGEQNMPIYVGRPPQLHIPTRNLHNLEAWRFELYSEQNAKPTCSIQSYLEEFQDWSFYCDDQFILPLNHSELLGEAPFGQYRLRISDTLGDITEFRFTTVPHLTIAGNQQLYLPARPGYSSEVKLQIEIDAESELESAAGQATFSLTSDMKTVQKRRYQVVLPSEAIRASLQLQRKIDERKTISIRLSIIIRRLRWSLLLDNCLSGWQDKPVQLSLEELDEYIEPYLLIDLPTWEQTNIEVFLEFHDERQTTLLTLFSQHRRQKAGFLRFDLRNARETLRQTDAACFQVVLRIVGVEDKPILQPVLRIRRGIHIDELQLDACWSSNSVTLSAYWSPNPVIRSRCIRLWSLSRPWLRPIVLPITDIAKGNASWERELTSFPSGEYLAEFTIEDPWLTKGAAIRPEQNAESVRRFILGSLHRRIEVLSSSPGNSSITFDSILERALLWKALDAQSEANADIEWCIQHLQYSCLSRRRTLVETFSDRLAVKLLKFNLIEREVLERAIEEYRSGELDSDTATWFCKQLLALIGMVILTDDVGRLLISFSNQEIQKSAVRRLIELSIPTGVNTIVDWLEAEQIIHTEAQTLLEANVAYAIHQLGKRPMTPTLDLLLTTMSRKYSQQVTNHFIRVGYWVRCQAGWGKIKRIELRDGQQSTYIARQQVDEGEVMLHLLLRAGDRAELISLYTASERIEFANTPQFFICSKCLHWATGYQELLYHEHNHLLHGGIHTELEPYTGLTLTQTDELEFSAQPPHNIWE